MSAGRTAGGVFIVLCCVLCVGHYILSSTLLYSTVTYPRRDRISIDLHNKCSTRPETQKEQTKAPRLATDATLL